MKLNSLILTLFIILGIVSIFTITSSTSVIGRRTYQPAQYTYEYKDINLDGVIDIADLVYIKNYLQQQDAMDVNDDGIIDDKDLTLWRDYMFPQNDTLD